jgi:UDP-glucose 4-epimerase
MKRVLVTGGAGFIGRWLVAIGQARSWRMIVYDNFSVGSEANLTGLEKVTVYRADIRDTDHLATVLAMEQVEIVYHLAALHYIPYCEQNPIETVDVNVKGTLSVLEAMRKADCSKLIFASTGALYPPLSSQLSEETLLQPQDLYGLTKLQGEQLIEYYHRRYGIRATIVRLFNTYGPYETNPHLLPHLIQTLKSGENEIRLGNLHPKRDYIYVLDVAEALTRLGEYCDGFDIYNLGSGCEYSVAEVVQLLSELLGRPLHIVQDPERIRPVDKPHQCADITRLCQRLRWQPTTSLREGLQKWLQFEGILPTNREVR